MRLEREMGIARKELQQLQEENLKLPVLRTKLRESTEELDDTKIKARAPIEPRALTPVPPHDAASSTRWTRPRRGR
jgi:hypothetical protein